MPTHQQLLDRFKAEDDPRHYLNTPFNVSGYTVATNGHALIIVPEKEGFKPYERKENGEHISKRIKEILTMKPGQFKAAPNFQNFVKNKCKNCDGSGLANEKDTEDVECKECEGEGSITFETDYNVYYNNCMSCDGDGIFVKLISKKVKCWACHGKGELFSGDKYQILDKTPCSAILIEMIRGLPNLMIFSAGGNRVGMHNNEAHTYKTELYFKSGDTFGVLMGYRI